MQIPTSLGATAVTRCDAIDVPMPSGTQVLAIRSGVNFVLVWHDDGTVARHAHLTFRGAIVQLGDWVAQGQLIESVQLNSATPKRSRVPVLASRI